MKRSTTISMMAAIATLALAAQSFAFGGGTGGGRMGGNMAGGLQMSSPMRQSHDPGSMRQNGSAGATMQGPMNGTGAQTMVQGGTGRGAGKQHGKTSTTTK